MTTRPAALAIACALAACGSSGSPGADDASASTTAGADALCADAVAEDVHPASLTHLLPGTPAPSYLTDPPTSGPHDSRPLHSDVVAEPLPRPRQVGLLEAGRVLIQHRDLDPDDVGALEALAGPDVVVAPGLTLDTPVIATAWTFSMRCAGVDVAAIDAFVAAHARRTDDDRHHDD